MKFQELRKVINPNEYITVWAKTKISGNKEDFDFDKFEAFSVKKVMCENDALIIKLADPYEE